MDFGTIVTIFVVICVIFIVVGFITSDSKGKAEMIEAGIESWTKAYRKAKRAQRKK